MNRTLTVLGWSLLAAALVSLLLMVVPIPDQIHQRIQIAAVVAGVLLALAGHMFSESHKMAEKQDHDSRFYLESCVAAYEEARKLLADGNNERVKWIEAGRALVHATELGEKVTIGPHQRVLEVHKLKYRGFFDDALRGKPAAFFFGAKDTSIHIDTAAAQSTAGRPKTADSYEKTSTVNELSPESIYAVWEAAQWPKEYKDPLGKTFSSREEGLRSLIYPGLHEFLEHKKRYHSASGELFPRQQK